MPMMSLLLFILAALGAAGLFLALAVRSLRPKEVEGGADPINWFVGALQPKDQQAIDQLKNRIVRAGLYRRDSVDLYLTVRTGMLVGAIIVALLLFGSLKSSFEAFLLATAIALFALIGPTLWLNLRIKKRKYEISRSLPTTLDLLVTCLDAGLNIEQAIDRISARAQQINDELANEFRMTLAEIRAGMSMTVAFRRFAERIDMEDVRTQSIAISQGSRLGSRISELLKNHARAVRQHQLIAMEEHAHKANAKLTLPLTVCFLPSVVLLLVSPAVVMLINIFEK